MKHFCQNIHGWFTFSELYRAISNHYPNGSHFVEIGVWKGKSAAFMAVELINQNKKVKFDCIDTWDGSEEHLDPTSGHYEHNLVKDKDYLYNHFLENIESVKHVINPIRKASLDAVSLYDDNSLDFIFIDAAHDYENIMNDIKAWYPKTKLTTGIIAGHDISHGPIRQAVNDFFGEKNLKIQESEDCWIVTNN